MPRPATAASVSSATTASSRSGVTTGSTTCRSRPNCGSACWAWARLYKSKDSGVLIRQWEHAAAFGTEGGGATVAGTAYAESMTCFTLEVGAGQTATVKIVECGGEDTAFNIAGVVDNQADYSFRTAAGTYQIDVYRAFAREAPVPFKMLVEVR